MTAKENMLRAIKHDNPEWVPGGTEATIWVHSPVVERPDKEGYDSFGVYYKIDEDVHGGTYPAKDGQTIRNLSNFRNEITIPDVDALDFSILNTSEGRLRPSELDRDNNLIMAFVEIGVFERSYMLLGMEEALINYIAEPELMAELANTIADYKVRLIRRFYQACPFDILWYGDDWGTQRNLFVDVDTWRAIIKPATKKVYDCAKELGVIINQHSCGYIAPIIPDIVEMGAEIWNPCQPCNDLPKLKSENKLTFCGGIDSQFVLDRPGVTAEDVRAEVRLRIDQLAQGGGYIATPSHSVPYNPDLIFAMNDEIEKYGKACYAVR